MSQVAFVKATDAILKVLGSNPAIMNRRIFDQEQIVTSR